jgi:hypothetical protein
MNNWELKSHSYQIADTGDYDGHYEITNGKITFFTKDEDEESLQKVVNALNESGCKFEIDDSAKWELEAVRKENSRLWDLLTKYKINPLEDEDFDF